jgi:hypothetical protein
MAFFNGSDRAAHGEARCERTEMLLRDCRNTSVNIQIEAPTLICCYGAVVNEHRYGNKLVTAALRHSYL